MVYRWLPSHKEIEKAPASLISVDPGLRTVISAIRYILCHEQANELAVKNYYRHYNDRNCYSEAVQEEKKEENDHRYS